jgi:hypothetical protein
MAAGPAGAAVAFAYTAPMADLEPTNERQTVKSRPVLVLVILIGSVSAFGYTIYWLLKGMRL